MDTLTRASDLVVRDFGLGGNGAHVVIPSIVGPLLAAALVFNRLYWRIHLVRTLGIDDLCIGLSLVFLFALAVVNLVAVNHGYGRPSNSLHHDDLRLAMQMFYLDQIFYKFTINLTKLSILTLYLRIFTQPWFVLTCWCCFALVSAYAVASILATVFQCTPINYFWDHHVPSATTSRPTVNSPAGSEDGPHCISTTAFWLANAVYNIATDIIILVTLPFMIWSLHLARSQKIGLLFVFGLGVFVFATSVLRLTTLHSGSQARDPLVGTVLSTMWTMIEASTAVVCACLPMCRTPVQRLWPKLFRSKHGSAGGVQTQTDTQSPSQTRAKTQAQAQPSGSRKAWGTDQPRTMTTTGQMNRGGGGAGTSIDSNPRELSGGLLAGSRGPGGRTMDSSEDDFDDVEMQSPPRRTRDETDRQGIMEAVEPVRMKGW